MSTTADYITKLDTLRDNLAANLTTKGIAGVSSANTLDTLVPKVLDIQSGGGGAATTPGTSQKLAIDVVMCPAILKGSGIYVPIGDAATNSDQAKWKYVYEMAWQHPEKIAYIVYYAAHNSQYYYLYSYHAANPSLTFLYDPKTQERTSMGAAHGGTAKPAASIGLFDDTCSYALTSASHMIFPLSYAGYFSGQTSSLAGSNSVDKTLHFGPYSESATQYKLYESNPEVASPIDDVSGASGYCWMEVGFYREVAL